MTRHAATYRFPLQKTIIAAVMLALLLSLGCWQIKRLEWKQDLLARMDAEMNAAPAALPGVIDRPSDWEYRPVLLEGRYLIDYEFLLKPRVDNGRVGYHLVMPFKMKDGPVVFIDRGWTDDAGLAAFPRPTDMIEIKGIVTLPRRHYFTPDNDPERNDWYWADVGAFARSLHFNDVSPVVVTTMLTRPDIPNNHLQYAVFWFSMSVIFLIVFILSCRSGQEGKI